MTPDIQYQYALVPGSNPDGKYVLAIVAKATYTVERGGRVRPADEPARLLAADKFFEPSDPLTCPCYQESDFIPWKPMTDVVIVGKARAPRGREVIQMGASVQVGTHRKDVLVIGDRSAQWRALAGAAFSQPKPFVEMELRYDRAYGGVDILSSQEGQALPYPRNLLGKGYVVRVARDTVEGLALPNLEDPRQMLSPEGLGALRLEEWHRMPMPCSFGVFGKSWYPRMSFAGVLPADIPLQEQLREEAEKQVPPDHVAKQKQLKLPALDFKFFNGASAGLAVPFLKGNEKMRLEGFQHDGDWEFFLPNHRPRIALDWGKGRQEPDVVLHTVFFDAEAARLELTWRAAAEYGGPDELAKITKLDLSVEPA